MVAYGGVGVERARYGGDGAGDSTAGPYSISGGGDSRGTVWLTNGLKLRPAVPLRQLGVGMQSELYEAGS